MNQTEAMDQIAAAASDAGADVFAHAIDIDSGAEIGLHADDAVVTASVFKVPVLTTYVRQVSAGMLDPASRVQVKASSVTLGPTGLSVFSDDADWSLRDIATSMITVSDNAATDILTGMVGVDAVNAAMVDLGLPGTVLIGDCAALFATMADDYGLDDPHQVDASMLADPNSVAALSVNTPERTNRSTPRESTSLLRLLWTDAAADAAGCAEARRILGLQIWPHRLSSGFPRDDVKISGKTGTIGIVRNEIGVVEFDGGRRFAVAVFLRTHAFRYRQPKADALIGRVGSILVDHLQHG